MQVPRERLRRLLAWWRPLARRTWLRHAPRSFCLHAQPTRQELGRAGEELAARALLRRGFVLLGRRVHTPHAEVDVWAQRGGISWILEVKTGRCARLLHPRRPPTWDLRWRPGGSLDHEQRQRLMAAARYLGKRLGCPASVALVEVLVDDAAGQLEVLAPLEVTGGELF